MLFPFRFAGNSDYMVVFDILIAFTYAFHLHAFIKETRFRQTDISERGRVRSMAFIIGIHIMVLSILFLIPGAGVLKALYRVFWVFPMNLL